MRIADIGSVCSDDGAEQALTIQVCSSGIFHQRIRWSYDVFSVREERTGAYLASQRRRPHSVDQIKNKVKHCIASLTTCDEREYAYAGVLGVR